VELHERLEDALVVLGRDPGSWSASESSHPLGLDRVLDLAGVLVGGGLGAHPLELCDGSLEVGDVIGNLGA
jgi:hypothetical protein